MTALLVDENLLSLLQLAIEHAVCDERMLPIILSAIVANKVKAPLLIY